MSGCRFVGGLAQSIERKPFPSPSKVMDEVRGVSPARNTT
jgi:hypothetical protein